jgi:hypothetical protein
MLREKRKFSKNPRVCDFFTRERSSKGLLFTFYFVVVLVVRIDVSQIKAF